MSTPAETQFHCAWPVDERAYLYHVNKYFTIGNYYIGLKFHVKNVWDLAEKLGFTRDQFCIALGLTREKQYDLLAALVDLYPEQTAVMCVYYGMQLQGELHGFSQSMSLVDVLQRSHEVAMQVLDRRTNIVSKVIAEEVQISGDFSF